MNTLQVLPWSLLDAVGVRADGLYFSTLTFTTLGKDDMQPVAWVTGPTTVESFDGALLMALLVFMLGRQTT